MDSFTTFIVNIGELFSRKESVFDRFYFYNFACTRIDVTPLQLIHCQLSNFGH